VLGAGGGRPDLSLENLTRASALARAAGIPVVLDASEVASAAYMWKEWEKSSEPLDRLVRRYCEAADLVYMTARGDAFCHTGGLIATHDEKMLTALQALVVVFEGLHTYGGQAGRDMEAFARGLVEMTDEGYLHFRRRKFDYHGRRLQELGLPLCFPVGTRGPSIDAAALMPDADRDGYRAEALAAVLYLASGVRVGLSGKLRSSSPGRRAASSGRSRGGSGGEVERLSP